MVRLGSLSKYIGSNWDATEDSNSLKKEKKKKNYSKDVFFEIEANQLYFYRSKFRGTFYSVLSFFTFQVRYGVLLYSSLRCSPHQNQQDIPNIQRRKEDGQAA